MAARRKFKTFVALLLLLLLINPMLVKSLHSHQDDHRHCSKNPAEGINPVHPHHENCEICSFEYVNVLPEEPCCLQVYSYEITDIPLSTCESGHSTALLFASPRAPPAFL